MYRSAVVRFYLQFSTATKNFMIKFVFPVMSPSVVIKTRIRYTISRLHKVSATEVRYNSITYKNEQSYVKMRMDID